MTAPGDLVLIFILVAIFVASCGYAAGRMHQRYQLKHDREAAYRDGYETASSRVFSLAARVAAPKRPARGAAPVQPTSPEAPPSSAPSSSARHSSALPDSARPSSAPSSSARHSSALPDSAPPSSALPDSARPGSALPDSARPGSAQPGSAQPGSAQPGSVQPGSVQPGSVQPGSPFPGTPLPGTAALGGGVEADLPFNSRSEAGPSSVAPTGDPASSGSSRPFGDADPPAKHAPATRNPDPGRAIRHQGVPTPAPGLIPHRRSAPEASEPAKNEGALGFPVPPPPPPSAVAEPAAVGGVTFQPFRDPRPADGSGPVLGRRDTPADPPPPSGGKHTVPDELVQAATYRLPPDRIFRAKVPNSTPLPEQTTTHLSVPKPRRRADENVVPPP